MPGAHKIGAAISGPRIMGGNCMDITLFLNLEGVENRRFSQKIEDFLGDRYDWTSRGPYDGNEWRKYRVAPRVHPSRPLFYAYFHRCGNKGAFRLPGATWGRFRCTVEPSPGHIRCRFSQETAGNRRLGSVTLGASPLAHPKGLRVILDTGFCKL